jgi:hypothetical protein
MEEIKLVIANKYEITGRTYYKYKFVKSTDELSDFRTNTLEQLMSEILDLSQCYSVLIRGLKNEND